MNPAVTTLIIIAAIGACFGSFITAASWRLPREEDIIVKPSHCPKCDAKLGFRDLFPILSWVFAKGKCRHCGAKVSSRYILTEIITSLIFIGLYLQFSLNWQFIILALLAVVLLVMIISDFETYIMPDSTTIATFVLAVAYHYYTHAGWSEYIFGFIACLVIALALKYGFLFITKRDGLGWGDIKFLPVAGFWIGMHALPVYFIISGLVGIVTGIIWKIFFKNPEYPFGPALAVAMYLLVLFPILGDLPMQLK